MSELTDFQDGTVADLKSADGFCFRSSEFLPAEPMHQVVGAGDGLVTYRNPKTCAEDFLSIEETMGPGLVRIWPGYFRGAKGEVVDDVEAYIAIEREPDFDLKAFRAKVEGFRDEAADDEKSSTRVGEHLIARECIGRAVAWQQVLDLLPPKPQPPSPEQVAFERIFINTTSGERHARELATAVTKALRQAGWLRDEQQKDGME